MSDTKQFATFFLNNLFLGVEVLKVQEVIRYQEMTRVPLAPSMVRGLINLRGQIFMAIDLRRCFEFPPLPEGRQPMNVVVRSDDGPVSLLVDEIGDVVEIEDDIRERPPQTVRGVARELVESVYKLKDRLLLVVNIQNALRATN
jgi:purine-binding chemotaxis protein CheW